MSLARAALLLALTTLTVAPGLACTSLLGDFEVSAEGSNPDGGTSDGSGNDSSTSAEASAPTPCTTDVQCPGIETTPPSCAIAKCKDSVCVYGAADRDGDGHRASECSTAAGVTIAIGDDCDDNDKELYAGHDAACATDGSGVAIVFPGGTPKGLCKLGTRSCVAGKPTACAGAVGPAREDCSTPEVDEDCDGSNVNGCPCAPINAVQPCDTHAGLDGKGPCRPGSQTCTSAGWSGCTGSVGPGPRDCSSTVDNDCSGTPDNTIDTACTCTVGLEQQCNQHPGFDGVGVCKAGTRKCFAGTPPSTSAFGGCTGDVGPTAEDCNPSGSDLNCDGIKGTGVGCHVTVNVYVNAAYTCGMTAPNWPAIFMTVGTAGVPTGYSLLTSFKLLASAGAGTVAVHRCYSTADSYHFTGFGACAGAGVIDQGVLGYATQTNGGTGWVELAEWYGKNYGPTALMRINDPKCCAGNCNPLTTKRYVLGTP